MLQDRDELRVQQEYTIQLLKQITDDYSVLKLDMQQVSKVYPGSDDEFSFLEELELLIVDISGYAQQIESTGGVKQLNLAITHLQQLQVFANPVFARFYAEARLNFPNIQVYLQQLDYLRLLTLEYLQMQQQVQPVSA